MFSKSTEYALRATVYLAVHSHETNKLTLAQVSEGIGSPQAFTAKIMQKLTSNNRVVHSVRGPGGGFFMTKRSLRLPLKAVLDAMEEGTVLDKCILGLHRCSDRNPCPMHNRYKPLRIELKTLFTEKTIGDMAAEPDQFL